MNHILYRRVPAVCTVSALYRSKLNTRPIKRYSIPIHCCITLFLPSLWLVLHMNVFQRLHSFHGIGPCVVYFLYIHGNRIHRRHQGAAFPPIILYRSTMTSIQSFNAALHLHILDKEEDIIKAYVAKSLLTEPMTFDENEEGKLIQTCSMT